MAIELQTEIQVAGIGSLQMSFKDTVYELIQKYKEIKQELERANENINAFMNVMKMKEEVEIDDKAPIQSLIQQATLLYFQIHKNVVFIL